ncbi:MAG: hypothetical protein HFJ50_08110 [Clostridia bacterium]|jgi:hypothetical protein|nr:hypothetical protein [Clostridia bacterium]
MRKVLISILLVILLAGFVLMVISGLEIAGMKVGYSVKEIMDKNDQLDRDIIGLRDKIQKEYEVARGNLDKSFKDLQNEKQSYEKAVAYVSDEDRQTATTVERYKIDYLWTKIGLGATTNNLVMKADLSNGSSGVENQYNMAFTVIGEYLSISEFIYGIEKDDTLGFRIEEFAVVPYSENDLQATFIIKNIDIDPTSLTNASSVSTGTVTNNPNDQTDPNADADVRQIGGVTVMSDYDDPTRNPNANKVTNNTVGTNSIDNNV